MQEIRAIFVVMGNNCWSKAYELQDAIKKCKKEGQLVKGGVLNMRMYRGSEEAIKHVVVYSTGVVEYPNDVEMIRIGNYTL